MHIQRMIEPLLLDKLQHDSRVVILYGPRQSGKTTLARSVLASVGKRTLELNGDDPRVCDLFATSNPARILSALAGYEVVFLDEAQRIPEIGLALKRLHDSVPGFALFVTGSSSLELASKTKEALTGRTWTFQLFPIALAELSIIESPFGLDE